MTFHELVGNLKTYEMNVNKKGEENKEKNLGFKETESNESDIDYEELAPISKNFKKLFERGMNYGKNSQSTKKKTTEKPQSGGCFNCNKIDHHIKECPMWEVEWKKKKSEKEKRELISKR